MSIEQDVFSWLKRRGLWTQTHSANKEILVGPGDDAAVMARPAGDVVISTDLLTDGVDFLIAQAKPEWVGRKALGVNLSDLAAMAARPWGFTLSVAVDKSWCKPVYGNLSCINYLKRLCEGALKLADEFNCPLIGGDTNAFDGPLVISVAIFGLLPQSRAKKPSDFIPWTRSCAQPGDVILVTGELGGSLLKRQFTFTPRVTEALYLREHYSVRAAMDISDGLSLDLSRLTAASGVGAELNLNAVPISRAAHKMQDGKSPLEHALSDGEDFELILTASPSEAKKILADAVLKSLGTKITAIGTITSQSGLWANGQPLTPSGWRH